MTSRIIQTQGSAEHTGSRRGLVNEVGKFLLAIIEHYGRLQERHQYG